MMRYIIPVINNNDQQKQQRIHTMNPFITFVLFLFLFPTDSSSNTAPTATNAVAASTTTVAGTMIPSRKKSIGNNNNNAITQSYGILQDDDVALLDELIFGHREVNNNDESKIEDENLKHDDYKRNDHDPDHSFSNLIHVNAKENDTTFGGTVLDNNEGFRRNYYLKEDTVERTEDIISFSSARSQESDNTVDHVNGLGNSVGKSLRKIIDDNMEFTEKDLDDVEENTGKGEDSFKILDSRQAINRDNVVSFDISDSTNSKTDIFHNEIDKNSKSDVSAFYGVAFQDKSIAKDNHSTFRVKKAGLGLYRGNESKTHPTLISNDEPLKLAHNIKSRKDADEISSSFPLSTSNHEVRDMAYDLICEVSETLSSILNGKVAGHIPCDIYGESLEQEIAAWELRTTSTATTHPFSDPKTLRSLQTSRSSFPDKLAAKQRLYGGAQYHRTMQTFHHRMHVIPIPLSTSEEISLLMNGISGQLHDGVDILRSVAILASRRMEVLADLILNELTERVEYVLNRIWRVVEYSMFVRPSGRGSTYLHSLGYGAWQQQNYDEAQKQQYFGNNIRGEKRRMNMRDNDNFKKKLEKIIAKLFEKFVQTKVDFACEMAREDVFALLKFVSWDMAFVNNSSGGGGSHVGECVNRSDTNRDVDERLLLHSSSKTSTKRTLSSSNQNGVISNNDYDFDDDPTLREKCGDDMGDLVGGVLNKGNDAARSTDAINNRVLDEDTILSTVVQSLQSLTSSNLALSGSHSDEKIHAAVNSLVQHVTKGWRQEISQIIIGKFNSFCFLPLHKEFEAFLRLEIEQLVYEKDVDEKID